MKHDPLPPRERATESDAEAVARARETFAAKQGVSHRVVSMWLRTWGQRNEKTFEEWLANWHG